MKILYYGPVKLNDIASASVHVYELVSNLANLGHEIVPLSQRPQKAVVRAAATRRPSLRARMNTGLRSVPMYGCVKGVASITWSLAVEISTFRRALFLVIRHRQRFDLIYRRHTLFASETLLARLLRIPSIREVNGIIADEAKIANSFDGLSLRLVGWFERRSMRKADRLIIVTPQMKELLTRDYCIPQRRVVVIENGANTDLFKPIDSLEARRELQLAQDKHYICFIGRLWPPQGVQYLIRSIPYISDRCTQVRFLVVGDGVMREELIALAERLGVAHTVVFTGMVPYHAVPLYINASDICVAPFGQYIDRKGGTCSLKMPEYLACGKPLVASRLNGLDIVEHNHMGVLVEPENPEALAGAIVKLLHDPELRRQMGENGRKYVAEHRSWASVARRVAEVCQQAVQERTAGRKRPTPSEPSHRSAGPQAPTGDTQSEDEAGREATA